MGKKIKHAPKRQTPTLCASSTPEPASGHEPHFSSSLSFAGTRSATTSVKHPEHELLAERVQTALRLQKNNKIRESGKIYEEILQKDPRQSDALHLSGLIFYHDKDYDEAERRIRIALDVKPDDTVYLNSLAAVLREAGKLDEAVECLTSLLQNSSSYVAPLLSIAKLYKQQARYSDAVLMLKKALHHESENLELLEEYGYNLSQIGQYDQSNQAFQKILAQNPAHFNALHLLACNYYFLKQYRHAVETYQKVLDINPKFGPCWSNKGAAHQSLAEFIEARECYQKSIQFDEKLPDVHNNYGNVLQVFGDISGAEREYLRAIELSPTYVEPKYSLGEIHLARGEFEEGWKGYAIRSQKREHDHRNFTHPVWDGVPSQTLKLLAYSEQGVGDIVMFGTCLPDLLNEVPNTTVELDPRLIPLFHRTFSHLRYVPRQMHLSKDVPVTVPGVDAKFGMGSLPERYRPSLESHPRHGYLKVDPQVRQMWVDRFARLGAGLNVGISWRGGKNAEVGARRSIPLAAWKPILQTPGVKFINLQYGDCSQDTAFIRNEFGVTLHHWSDADPIKNLDGFSAQMSACDLVISIDNATVHFAGGLGVPCWTMLGLVPEWRWMLTGERSYWYESLRLFRQTKVFEWTDLAARVAETLKLVSSDASAWKEEMKTLNSRPFSPEVTSSTPVTPSLPSPKMPISISSSNLSKTSTPVVKTKPKLAIITPVGPGHSEIYEENVASIKRACEQNSGPFEKVIPLRLNDTEGTVGRSYARNFGVQQAIQAGCEWVFFLDADDVLVPGAFAHVEPYLEDYDAIWGQIYSFQHGTQNAESRPGQLGKTDRYEDILNVDPFHSLQMGHFVRTKVAAETPFDETMDTGEDFHYYLRLWQKCRCIKIDQPFFANRRGMHSTGPRSANGRDWMTAVAEQMSQARQSYQLKLQQSPPQPFSPAVESIPTPKPQIVAPEVNGVAVVEPANPHDITSYWEQDQFQNIIPQNVKLGQFPEGWNVRDYLGMTLTPYLETARAQGQKDLRILEVGCGYGRLSSAFKPGDYLGVDVNKFAIDKARQINPEHSYQKVSFVDDYPQSALTYAFCVLLHIDDDTVSSVISKMCHASKIVVVAEILGRKWRRGGLPPVYNREQVDYEQLFQAQGYRLFRSSALPYLHYENTNITFLMFQPESSF